MWGVRLHPSQDDIVLMKGAQDKASIILGDSLHGWLGDLGLEDAQEGLGLRVWDFTHHDHEMVRRPFKISKAPYSGFTDFTSSPHVMTSAF